MKGMKLDAKYLVSASGLTLSELIVNTERLRKYRGDDIVIKAIKKAKTKQGRSVIYGYVQSATDPTKMYEAWITIMDKDQKRIPPDCKVQVQCMCADYLYNWEFANAAYRAARIYTGNGEYPYDKNPRLKFGLCKHLYGLARTLLPNKR